MVASLLLFACAGAGPTADTAAKGGAPPDLVLRWFPEAEGTEADVGQDALAWALSDLGAAPTEPFVASGDDSEWRWTIPLVALALPGVAAEALAPAFEEAAESEETAIFGAFDVGRFLMRTLYEPRRYAAITGACATLGEWAAGRLGATEAYAVTTSQLTDGERIIDRSLAVEASAVAYLATEVEGTIAEGGAAGEGWAVGEQETLDMMPNGQFRYAVYDTIGAWIPGARSTPAGQPGKCLWCHEHRLQPGTAENASAPGYLSYAEWIERVARDDAAIAAWRSEVGGMVPYDRPEVHEAAEALVENFLWPTPARVAAEWGVSVEDVQLLELPAYGLEEYGWTGRMARADVDAAAPWGAPLVVLSDSRELYDGDRMIAADSPDCGGR